MGHKMDISISIPKEEGAGAKVHVTKMENGE